MELSQSLCSSAVHALRLVERFAGRLFLAKRFRKIFSLICLLNADNTGLQNLYLSPRTCLRRFHLFRETDPLFARAQRLASVSETWEATRSPTSSPKAPGSQSGTTRENSLSARSRIRPPAFAC